MLLIVANLIISCLCLCKKSQNARDLEALKVWWQENLEKLKNGFYNTDVYKATQKESIDAYIEQLWIE